MRLGATHIIEWITDTTELTTGDSWNLGIGGGASILTEGDKTAIAPNGGAGIGSASTRTDLVIEGVYAIWHDPSLVK
jgi:hypothetical protein